MRPRCRWRPRLFAAGLALSLPAAGCGRVVDTSRPAGADAETADVEVSVDAPVEALPELLLFTGFERRFVPGITGATAIDSAGDAYHCVLRAAAHPLCWRGPMACESSAALEPAVDVGVAPRQLARGCFIRSDGRAGCRDRQGAPARHVDVADAVEIRGDARGGCVRTDAGAVWCWEADELWRPTPARAIAADSLGAIVQLVSAPRSPGGPALHCARQRSGGVSCWGAGAWHIDVDRGEDEPRALPGAANVRDLAVDRRLCVVLEGGAVRCSADEYAAPLRPIAGITDAVAVEVFGADLCALGRGGVRCAGPSYGAANDSVAVTGLGDVARLVAIEGAHCAVEPEGRHRCWGPGPAPRAHRMPELEGVRAVAERCAVHDDGRVSCWVHPRSCDSLPLCGQEPRLRDGR